MDGADLGPTEENLAFRAARAVLDAAGATRGAADPPGEADPRGRGAGRRLLGRRRGAPASPTLVSAEPLRRRSALGAWGASSGSDVPFFLGESTLAWGRGQRGASSSRCRPRRGVAWSSSCLRSTSPRAARTPRSPRDRLVGGAERRARVPSPTRPRRGRRWPPRRATTSSPVVPGSHPEVAPGARLRSAARAAAPALLSGSGAACFGVFADRSAAEADGVASLRERLGVAGARSRGRSRPSREPVEAPRVGSADEGHPGSRPGPVRSCPGVERPPTASGRMVRPAVIRGSLARRLMAGHRSLEPAVVVRIHPGQSQAARGTMLEQSDHARRRLMILDAAARRARARGSGSLVAGRAPRRPAQVVGRGTRRRFRAPSTRPTSTGAPGGSRRGSSGAASGCSPCARGFARGGSDCDEIVGRFCLWFDEGDRTRRSASRRRSARPATAAGLPGLGAGAGPRGRVGPGPAGLVPGGGGTVGRGAPGRAGAAAARALVVRRARGARPPRPGPLRGGARGLRSARSTAWIPRRRRAGGSRDRVLDSGVRDLLDDAGP